LVLLLATFGKVPADAAEVTKTELYVIQTTTLTEKQFLTGTRDGKPASIAAELRLPPSRDERLPAVILLHGSGGIIPIEEHWSRMLNDMGIATFQLDVLTGRGIGNTLTDQAQLSPLNGINDAFRALELLSSHPRIDPKRIGILGGSRGATGALFTSLRRFERMYAAPGTQFAVHLVFYANCGTSFIDGDDVANRPIRLFHGTADDVSPVEPCRSYVARLQRAGKDVRLMELNGAHHGFDNVGGKVRRVEQGQASGHCVLQETTAGLLVERQSGMPFTYGLPCVKRGVTAGYDASAHEQALKEVKATLQQVFRMPAPTRLGSE
jgi:dienelactone hydrolase